MATTSLPDASDRRWGTTSRYHGRACVTRIEPVTPTGTVRIRLEVVDGVPFAYLPGQFVGIEYHAEGLGYRRSPYCLLPPPAATRPDFELLVRVVHDGQVSAYLGRRRVGDVVAFRPPTGRSMVPRDPGRDVVLLATGVGVAPCLALVEHLLHDGFEPQIRLYWGLRLPEDVCLIEELDGLQRRYPNFAYGISLSRPPEGWPGLRGRLTESVPPLLPTLGGRQYYLCGNGAMVAEMDTALSDLGVAEEFIYKEAYFNRRHRPDPEAMAAIRDRFVADDLFSPFAHQAASLFEVRARPKTVSRNADPNASSDLFRRIPSGRGPASRAAPSGSG